MQAVIYTRVSTGKQLDGTSLETQEEDCRAYCGRQGFPVALVTSDVYTGYDSLSERPGLQKALQALQAGEAEVLVVWKLDRLAREQVDGAVFLRMVDKAGGRVETALEGPAETTAQGKLMAALKLAFAELERETIVARTRPGLRKRATSGKLLPNGRPKYGLLYTDAEKSSYALDPETAPTVEHIYDMAYNGRAVHSIAQWLNAQRIPTPTARLAQLGCLPEGRQVADHWGRTQVYRILTDPSYKGEHVAYRFQEVKTKVHSEHGLDKTLKVMHKRKEDDPTRIIQSIPAIVSTEVWDAVQQRLGGRTLERIQDNVDMPLLGKGFVYCAHCGSRCGKERVKQRGKYVYIYRCNSLGNRDTAVNKCPYAYGIRTAGVDAGVWEQVKEIAKDTPRLQRLVRSRVDRVAEYIVSLANEELATREELKELQQQETTLVRRIAKEDNDVIASLYRKELQDITDRERAAANKLDRMENEVGYYRKRLDANMEVKELVEELKAEWGGQPVPDVLDSLSRDDKRRILDALNVRVLLHSRKTDYPKEHDGKQWELTFGEEEVPSMGSEALCSSRGPERRFW